MADIGLSWDPKCLEFYKQERQIMTFSAMQVRRPPSADHLDSTTPYLEWLADFDTGLDACGVGLAGAAPGSGGFWRRLFSGKGGAQS